MDATRADRVASRAEKAADTVRRKGAQAKRDGLGPAACPYPDTRKADGRLTFSRHWRKCWFEGYYQQTEEKDDG